MRCVSHEEGKDKLIELHESTCGLEGPCLYRRKQRVGLYWPMMKENCDQFQEKCLECREHFERSSVCFVSIQGDWRRPYIEYIRDETLPLDVKEASVVKKKAARFFMEKNELFRRSLRCQPIRCVPEVDIEVLMKEVHQGVSGEHQGARRLYEELMRLGYYWPTMEADTLCFVRQCMPCQKFGLPKRILSDNGTPFVNKIVSNMLAQFNIIHDRSSPYYPKGNGQAKATNKSLLKILSRMVQDSPHDWSEYLPLTLWAYRTSKRGPTQATPFSLVYGADAVLLAEITVPSAWVVLEGYIEHIREADLEALKKRRDKACANHLVYQRKIIKTYDKLVSPRMFQDGDLVLKDAKHIVKGVHATKFTPKWEGPFKIKKVHSSGYCALENPSSKKQIAPINFKNYKINIVCGFSLRCPRKNGDIVRNY
ncbi:reverse transcriptase [Senna tora]|uniref:Reverse transcriptase n=1 Tax=Senna tora TaxID=362788 RepID=A0A834TIV0_9FABA|nr:reverse transcriptase [Senna tora]